MTEPMEVEFQSPHGELRTAFYNPHEVKRRRRTSPGQFKILERSFSDNPKPDANTRRLLAQKLSMSPRGIQVWFQNRRAKNRQASSTASSGSNNDNNSISTDIADMDHHSNKNNEQDALPGSPFTPASFSDQQDEVGLNAEKWSDEDMRGSLRVPTLQRATPPRSSEPSEVSKGPGLLPATPSPHMSDSGAFPNTGDDAFIVSNSWESQLEWKNHPPLDEKSSLSSNLPVQQLSGSNPTYADSPIDLSLNRNHIYPAMPPGENPKNSYSNGALILGGPHQIQNIPQYVAPQAPINSHSGVDHQRPSTLSLMRRMSMPATIRINNIPGTSVWSAHHPNPSTEDLKHPPVPASQGHIDTEMRPPQYGFATPSRSREMSATAQLPKEQGDARARVRTYPLSRRVSIHETGIHSTHSTTKLKNVFNTDVQNTSHSEAESLAAAAAARRRRRSSVGKVVSALSVGPPAPVISAMEFVGGAPQAGIPVSTLSTSVSPSIPAIAAPTSAYQTNPAIDNITSTNIPQNGATCGLDRKTMDIWMDESDIDQRPPTEGRSSDVSGTIDHVMGGLVIGPPSELADGTVNQQFSGPPTPENGFGAAPGARALSPGGTEQPNDIKKGRRRSSLKSTKGRHQPGARVQFDLQLTPADLHQPPVLDGGENSMLQQSQEQQQYVTKDVTPDQALMQNKWLNDSLLSIPVSGAAQMNPFDTSGATNTVANMTQITTSPLDIRGQEGVSVDTYFACLQNIPMANQAPEEPGQTLQILQDPHHARRNSCPARFVEYYRRRQRIEAGLPETNSNHTPTQHELAMLQLQQQLQQQLQVQQQQQQLQHVLAAPDSTHQQDLMNISPSQRLHPLQNAVSLSGTRSHATISLSTEESFSIKQSFPEGHSLSFLEHSSESPAPVASHFTTEDSGNYGGGMEAVSHQRTQLSSVGPRHSSSSDSYHLPQLQTPRILAQLQHQVERPAWSSALSTVDPRTPRSRHSLPVSLQNVSNIF
ncbi:hypothetical protein BGX26_001676 [Mortierella sp. AD094]|nr:hypothetical protein BGX26_001676 [Mortierella sp. AD094]